jgi:hypothetical protein
MVNHSFQKMSLLWGQLEEALGAEDATLDDLDREAPPDEYWTKILEGFGFTSAFDRSRSHTHKHTHARTRTRTRNCNSSAHRLEVFVMDTDMRSHR